MVSILASRPSCPWFDSQHSPKNFRWKNIDIAEVNQWRCLEVSRQWLENVDWNHLVLTSGKLVLQKITTGFRTIPNLTRTLFFLVQPSKKKFAAKYFWKILLKFFSEATDSIVFLETLDCLRIKKSFACIFFSAAIKALKAKTKNLPHKG